MKIFSTIRSICGAGILGTALIINIHSNSASAAPENVAVSEDIVAVAADVAEGLDEDGINQLSEATAIEYCKKHAWNLISQRPDINHWKKNKKASVYYAELWVDKSIALPKTNRVSKADCQQQGLVREIQGAGAGIGLAQRIGAACGKLSASSSSPPSSHLPKAPAQVDQEAKMDIPFKDNKNIHTLDLNPQNAGGLVRQYDYEPKAGGVACNFHAMESILYISQHLPEVVAKFKAGDTHYFGNMRRTIMNNGIESRTEAQKQGKVGEGYDFLPVLATKLTPRLNERYGVFGLSKSKKEVNNLPKEFRVAEEGKKDEAIDLETLKTEELRKKLLAQPSAGKVHYMLLSPNGSTIAFIQTGNGAAFIFDSHKGHVSIANEDGLIDYIKGLSGGAEVEFDYYSGELPAPFLEPKK